MLTNAFHFDVLKPYLSVYAEAADVLVVSTLSVLQCCSTLHHYLVQDQWSKQEGQSFDIVPYMKHYTLDVMLRCACSYESNCQITGLVLTIVTICGINFVAIHIMCTLSTWNYYTVIFSIANEYLIVLTD